MAAVRTASSFSLWESPALEGPDTAQLEKLMNTFWIDASQPQQHTQARRLPADCPGPRPGGMHLLSKVMAPEPTTWLHPLTYKLSPS